MEVDSDNSAENEEALKSLLDAENDNYFDDDDNNNGINNMDISRFVRELDRYCLLFSKKYIEII
jgi:hypothetical protein